MVKDDPSMFFKAMNFFYVEILAYGFLAEIFLFIFLVFLFISFLFLFLNSKYFRYVAKERLSFFKNYTFMFLREKFNFIRSFLFTIHKLILKKWSYKYITFFGIGILIILIGIGVFVYFLKQKYAP